MLSIDLIDGCAMEIRQLKTFQTTAKTLSFSSAAEMLNYAQSTVSSQILALEEELGAPLFDRLGKQVVLTDAGRRLLTYAEQILALVDEAQQVVNGHEVPAGTITIGAPESLCVYVLPPLLRRYREEYPQVRLALQPGSCPDLRRLTKDGRFDIVFTLEPAVHSTDLDVEVMRSESICVIAPPDHPLAHKSQVTAADLQGEPVLLTEATCSYRRLFEAILERADVHPAMALDFTSVEAIKQCVRSGMGLAVLPAVAIAREVAAGEIVVLNWADMPISVTVQLSHHKDKWISPAVQAFMAMAREMIV